MCLFRFRKAVKPYVNNDESRMPDGCVCSLPCLLVQCHSHRDNWAPRLNVPISFGCFSWKIKSLAILLDVILKCMHCVKH